MIKRQTGALWCVVAVLMYEAAPGSCSSAVGNIGSGEGAHDRSLL